MSSESEVFLHPIHAELAIVTTDSPNLRPQIKALVLNSNLLEDGDGLLDESVAGELSREVQFGVSLEDGGEHAEQLDDQGLV